MMVYFQALRVLTEKKYLQFQARLGNIKARCQKQTKDWQDGSVGKKPQWKEKDPLPKRCPLTSTCVSSWHMCTCTHINTHGSHNNSLRVNETLKLQVLLLVDKNISSIGSSIHPLCADL